ncbi:MAG: response regulator [Gemmataceae bacterium]|nr:response regulator [Gemmataceae bacterium]MDW8265334.1 response regulator [Gemmataceae bacterium]
MAGTPTVLLIDDDADILTAMSLALQRRGYRVVTARDGLTGLAAAERELPDVVVVDMLMPRQSGFPVLQKLKQQPRGGPRVIMITASEGCRQQAYAEILGVDDYIRKPFPMESLLSSIERLCTLPNAVTAEPTRNK